MSIPDKEMEALMIKIGGVPKSTSVKQGTPPGRRKKQAEKSAAQIGKEGEIQAGEQMAAVFGGGFKRSHQGRAGGGVFNPDLTLKHMNGWAWEVKTTENLCLPEWIKTLEADNGPKRGINFLHKGKRYVVLEVSILPAFIQDGAGAMGYVLELAQP